MPKVVMMSMLQQMMPTSMMAVRLLLRRRLRTIILPLKEKRPHRAGKRSSRMRAPLLGGLGRSSSAVCSSRERRSVTTQMRTDSATDRAAMP